MSLATRAAAGHFADFGTAPRRGQDAGYDMSPPIHSILVATAGLDLLHATRLKLASSLMLADRIDVTLEPWSGQRADLVIVDLDSTEGQLALAKLARARGTRVLTVSRNARAGLRHGATVREINDQMRHALLSPAPQTEPPAEIDTVPALLDLCRINPNGPLRLLRLGDLELVVDPVRGCLRLPATLDLESLVSKLDSSEWIGTPIELARFEHELASRLPRQRSFETLFFSIAAHKPALLPADQNVANDTAIRLHHWPDMEVSDAQTGWLMAIAALHARAWRPSQLAEACKLPRQTVECLFAAAHASGLTTVEAVAPTSSSPRRDEGNSRFFSWVARRFGLNLFKA